MPQASPFEQLGQEGMQATPVHHTGSGTMQKPQPGSQRDQWLVLKGRAEKLLQEHPLGDPYHNQVQNDYDNIIQHLGVEDYQHERLEQGMEPDDLGSAFKKLQSSPESMRGIKGELPPQRR